MKLKRIMAVVLCFAMVLSTMSFNVFAEDVTTPSGVLGTMYVQAANTEKNTSDRNRVYGEIIEMANITESVVIKLYSDEALIATTTLAKTEYLSNSTLGVNIVISGSTSSSWNTVWEDGMPRADLVPTKAVLYLDGTKMNTANVTLNGIDDLGEPTVWETLPGVNAAPSVPATAVAIVNGTEYTDIQEAIVAAVPSGTVELLSDVTVEEWVMVTQSLTIGDDSLITVDSINGLTIDGKGHTLTINSIESARNGGYLFFDADNLNVKDLTIQYAEGLVGGIGLQSGNISNVTFNGGVYGVFPGTGEVTITDCTFKTTGTAIYYEANGARDNLVVERNKFEIPNTANVIIMRGNETFTNNTIVSGRTVNVASGSPVVKGNDFGNVRLKVYNEATATIEDNVINVLAFNDETEAKSTFKENTLSDEAQQALDAVTAPAGPVEVSTYENLIRELAKDNANIILTNDITADATQSSGYGKAGIVVDAGDVLDGAGHTLTINNANSTWDCVVAMRGGTVKNLTIAGAMRGVFMPGANGDVVVDNCVFKDVIYTFNSDAGSKEYTVTIKDTVLNGWTSFSNAHKAVTFESCNFGEANDYAYCRPYQATTFIDCDFDEGYEFDTASTPDYALEFKDCTYAGEPLGESNGEMFSIGGSVVIDGKNVNFADPAKVVAKIGTKSFESLEDAFKAANEGDTIVLQKDASPLLKRQTAITKASVIDLNGKTLTLTEYDLYFGTTTFENGNIVVAENAVKDSGTAVFWMFGGQTLTFENVKIGATGFKGCYLIGTNGGTGAIANLNNSEITIANDAIVELTAVLSGNGDNDVINITDSTINVSNISGRLALGGSYTVAGNSTINANGVKEGFYIRDGQNLTIKDNSEVTITLIDDEGRYGINLNGSATYTKADTAKVIATDNMPDYVAKIGNVEYLSVAEAVEAAKTGDKITLLSDVEMTNPVVISGKSITLDLGEYTIYDKNTSKYTSNDDIWGLIALENSAKLTICGSGTIDCNYAKAQGGWTGMAYCIDVDNTSELTVNGGNFINGNGGIQTLGTVTVNDGTFISHNGGTCIMANYEHAKVTVNDGIFKDSVEDNDIYTGSGAVWAGFGATVNINGGTYDFAADPGNNNIVWTLFPAQNAIEGILGQNADMTVTGGTFINFNPATDVVVNWTQSAGFEFGSVVADGYVALESMSDKFIVGTKPTATVNDLGKLNVTEYLVWDGSFGEGTGEMPLNFVMQFVADQNEKDMETSPYADWYADFVITVSGLKNGSFEANGCYLAGYYEPFGWVKVPIDGMVIEEGIRYPVMLGVGLGQKYEYICSGVKDFRCAMFLTDEVLEQNPDLKVNLELAVVDNSEGGIAALEALRDSDSTKVLIVESIEYTAEDFEIKKPTGKVAYRAYVNDTADREGIQVDLNDVYAKESLVVKLFDAQGNLLTTTTLKAGGVEAAEYTCNIVLEGRTSSSWDTEITAEKLSFLNMPETIELWCDGELVDTFENALGAGTNVDETAKYIALDCVVDPVAQIDDTKYASLQDAVNAANGKTVTVLKDIDLGSTTVTIPADVAMTVDLNGKTINGECNASQAHMIMVAYGADLTILDSSAEQTGKITYAAGTSNVGWTIDVEGDLVLESGTIELTGEWSIGYAVDVRPNAWGIAYTEPTTFIMNDGNIISSDGAVRVASSSADSYPEVSASFTMNGGEIDADWDGVFVQQSNTAWDTLSVTINDGTIKSKLNPVRFYGPAAISYVNGEDCVKIVLNGGTLTYTGTETKTWLVENILRLGGGVTEDDFLKDATVTASATFAESNVAEGYKWVESNDVYTLEKEEPTTELFKIAGTTSSLGSSLALNFYWSKLDELTEDKYYAVVEHEKEEGKIVKTTIPYADWIESGNYEIVCYTGIAAKEMADNVKMTIYYADGTPASETYETSLRKYALNRMNRYIEEDDANNLWLPALMDMLNYGAAAQEMFSYNISDPANKGAEGFNDYASKEYTLNTEGCDLSSHAVAGTTLSLKDVLMLNIYFKEVTKDMYAEYSYTTHAGTPMSGTVYYDSFISNEGYLGVPIGVSVANADALVTVTMFDGDNKEVGKAVYNAHAYLNNMINKNENVTLYPALAKFAASAKKAFEQK